MKTSKVLPVLALLGILLFASENRASAKSGFMATRNPNLVMKALQIRTLALMSADGIDGDCTMITSYPEYTQYIQYQCCPPAGVSGDCILFGHNHAFEAAPDPVPPPQAWACTATLYIEGDYYYWIDGDCWMIR
jgi:hypothetical protein